MSETVITFTPDGNGHCLYTEAISLQGIGRITVERATNIEFDEQAQYWRVYDVRRFPMFNAPTRELCLAWESAYLNALEDRKHELPNRAGSVAVSSGVEPAESHDPGGRVPDLQ